MVKQIEESTLEQAQSKIWFQQRAGRVTASRLKAAVVTNTASQSLMNAVCYPESLSFKSEATTYGCKHEEQACRQYECIAASQHVDLSISKSGLVVDPSYPFNGASPDSVINCKCCGFGVLEIKCPYSCCDTSLREKANESPCFLDESDRNLTLNVYHAYYYQVRTQIKLCKANFCDFVLFRREELFVQRVYLDEPFISIALAMRSYGFRPLGCS